MNKQSQGELVPAEASRLPAVRNENAIGAMMNELLSRASTPEMLKEATATIRELASLYNQQEDRDAAKQFAVAFAALQSELPAVAATHIIPGKNGEARSVFAPYEDIMEAIKPALDRHGFSVSFSRRVEGDRLIAICKLRHASGYSESNEFSVKISKGPPGCSEAQASGSDASYAKRYALCDALNIAIDKDNDARAEGGYIDPKVAADWERRLKAVGGDIAAFLKFADAANFAEIREGKASALEAALAKKESRARKGATLPPSAADDVPFPPDGQYQEEPGANG